jgi:hypothetical protein
LLPSFFPGPLQTAPIHSDLKAKKASGSMPNRQAAGMEPEVFCELMNAFGT